MRQVRIFWVILESSFHESKATQKTERSLPERLHRNCALKPHRVASVFLFPGLSAVPTVLLDGRAPSLPANPAPMCHRHWPVPVDAHMHHTQGGLSRRGGGGPPNHFLILSDTFCCGKANSGLTHCSTARAEKKRRPCVARPVQMISISSFSMRDARNLVLRTLRAWHCQ